MTYSDLALQLVAVLAAGYGTGLAFVVFVVVLGRR